jgi:hypothetical protein
LEQFSSKGDFSLRSVSLNWTTCLLMIRLLWLFVPLYLDDSNFYFSRFQLKVVIEDKLGFMDILWRVVLVECMVVLLVLAVKILVALLAYLPLPDRWSFSSGSHFLGSPLFCSSQAVSRPAHSTGYSDIESARRTTQHAAREINPHTPAVPEQIAVVQDSSIANYDNVSLTSLLASATSALGIRIRLADRLNLRNVSSQLLGQPIVTSAPQQINRLARSHSHRTEANSSAGLVLGSENESLLAGSAIDEVSPAEDISMHYRGMRQQQAGAVSTGNESADVGLSTSAHSNNSSDAGDNEFSQSKSRQELEVYFGLRRLFTCIDCCSLLYRSLLPLPLWFVYLHRGSYAASLVLPGLYLAVKFYSLMWVLTATAESFVRIATRELVRGVTVHVYYHAYYFIVAPRNMDIIQPLLNWLQWKSAQFALIHHLDLLH